MNDILILYEGKYGHSEKAAYILRDMLGGVGCLAARDAPEKLEGVEKLILVFGFLAWDTCRILKPYLRERQEALKHMVIGVVGVGLAKQALIPFLRIIEEPMGRKADGSWFIMGGYKAADLTQEDQVLLEKFWGKKGLVLKDEEHFREESVREIAGLIDGLAV